MSSNNFPNFLDDAQEILVEDGGWIATFTRSLELSEGCPVFTKRKGTKETWWLKKVRGEWRFYNFKSGNWHCEERWEPKCQLWFKRDNAPRNILIRVTKRLSREDKMTDENWGDNLLRTMWQQKIGHDIKIRLKDGQEIDAHKTVIAAACPAWKGLWEPSMVEGESGVIVVSDAHPEVVKGFVKAMYLGEFEDQTLLPEIALMADRYNTEQLMHKVVEAIRTALETEGPSFYYKVIETVKRLTDNKYRRKLKTSLFSMNKDISEDIFYKRLGIN